MRTARNWMLLLFIFCGATSNAFAYYIDKNCTSQCFATGHDCDYCAYQCQREPTRYIQPIYRGDTRCELSPQFDAYDDE